jgi:iron complex transport system ATP-binding protein
VRLEARNLTAGYGTGFRIVDADLVIEEFKMTGVIGRNGSGKSTLLRTLARVLKPQRGVVLLDGEVLHQLPNRDVAKKLAFLGQPLEGVPDLTIEELAYRGRFPYQTMLHRDAKADREAVEWALDAMNLQGMRQRSLKQLSHGEMRRAWTALALAQQPDILLLDEPTAFLDMAHQFELLDLLAKLTEHGVTIVVSLHDLWLAAIYCQRVIAMSAGKIVASGPTDEVLTVDLIRDVFGVEVAMQPHPKIAGKHVALPVRRRDPARPQDDEMLRKAPTPNPSRDPSPHRPSH